MNFPSSIIKNAVEAISNFPGIGKKTALRLVIYLLRNKKIAYNLKETMKSIAKYKYPSMELYVHQAVPVVDLKRIMLI